MFVPLVVGTSAFATAFKAFAAGRSAAAAGSGVDFSRKRPGVNQPDAPSKRMKLPTAGSAGQASFTGGDEDESMFDEGDVMGG